MEDKGRERLRSRSEKTLQGISGQDDLSLSMLWSPERVHGAPDAPAWFSPEDREVTISAHFALGDKSPSKVNPLTPDGRKRDPLLVGLISHEAAHVVSTQWGDRSWAAGMSPSVHEALTLLEEPRIEGRHIQRRYQDRQHLRAASTMIDLAHFGGSNDDGPSPMSTWQAASTCLLTMARADAGVLYPSDVEHIEPILRESLTDEVYERLQNLWREALEIADGDVQGLTSIAERWVKIVGQKPEGISFLLCASEPPEESEFVYDGLGGELGELGEKLSEMSHAVRTDVIMALDDSPIPEEDDENKSDEEKPLDSSEPTPLDLEHYAKRRERTVRALEGKQVAKVNTSHTFPTREPSDGEREMATQIGRVFSDAQFRERKRLRVTSESPPGRLRGREAMLSHAQRSLGMPVTARPFQSRVNRHVEQPPIRLGVMVDISYSMQWATKPIASLAWATSSAMSYAKGHTMTVAFGARVTILTPLGEASPEVIDFSANSSGHAFGTAFDLLDGATQLVSGRGMRVLIVVSDGHYQFRDRKDARRAVSDVRRTGGRVVWVAPNFGRTLTEETIPQGATPAFVSPDPETGVVMPDHVIDVFTTALFEALEDQR